MSIQFVAALVQPEGFVKPMRLMEPIPELLHARSVFWPANRRVK